MSTATEAIQRVLDDLALAGRALKHLPPMRLPRVEAWWPDVVRDAHDAYGTTEERFPSTTATPEEIDALNRVLAVLLVLDESERRLVLARATGFSWRRIMRQRRQRGEGVRYERLKRLFRECVYRLATAYIAKAA